MEQESGGPAGEPESAAAAQLAEGLRERKKRLTRQMLSDTATAMFLERGFDGFRVSEVAEACDVSEKTVYNYFPTKESLILDREDYVADAIRHALGPEGGGRSPVEAIVEVLAQERRDMRTEMPGLDDETGLALFRRFITMVRETPSLRAAAKEMSDRLARIAAEALAERAEVGPDAPEPTIAAHALIGLGEVQERALRRELPEDRTVEDVYRRAEQEVDRAARLIDTGLWSFSAQVSGASTRDELRIAAEAVQGAARQVMSALKQAQRIWSDHAHAGTSPEEGDSGDDSRYSSAEWRDLQRETVQRWREAQRAHQQDWREAKQRMKQELKDELRQAARARQEEARRRRHT